MARVITLCGAILLGGVLILGTHPGFAQTTKGGVTTDKPAATAKGGKVDLNAASQADLEALPGIGPATAKKIIAGRPYSSVKDLSKAGVPAKTMDKIAPMVTVGAAATAAPPAAAPPAAAPPTASKPSVAKSSQTEERVPPAKGMVWVNTKSGVFHSEGDRWYGKTKEGKFMTEADAVKAGYRAT